LRLGAVRARWLARARRVAHEEEWMHATALLKDQHKRIGSLFRRVIEADACNKPALFEQLADVLVLHTDLEEHCFYPAVRARRTEDILLESLEEHWIMKRVLEQLFELVPDDPAFDARLRVLHELIENHFEEEESELFPKVGRGFGNEALGALGVELSQLADRLTAERDAHHQAATLAGGGGRAARFRDFRLQR
jgi:hemerythrin superfamily protein